MPVGRKAFEQTLSIHWKPALRYLSKTPALSVIVIATLAIGIGANTAIFSLVYGMLLRPFPYFDAERLVKINRYPVKNPTSEFTLALAEVEDIRARTSGFKAFGSYQNQRVNLVGDGPSIPVNLTLITPEVFPAGTSRAPCLGIPDWHERTQAIGRNRDWRHFPVRCSTPQPRLLLGRGL